MPADVKSESAGAEREKGGAMGTAFLICKQRLAYFWSAVRNAP